MYINKYGFVLIQIDYLYNSITLSQNTLKVLISIIWVFLKVKISNACYFTKTFPLPCKKIASAAFFLFIKTSLNEGLRLSTQLSSKILSTFLSVSINQVKVTVHIMTKLSFIEKLIRNTWNFVDEKKASQRKIAKKRLR